jgi:hypothetical protein
MNTENLTTNTDSVKSFFSALWPKQEDGFLAISTDNGTSNGLATKFFSHPLKEDLLCNALERWVPYNVWFSLGLFEKRPLHGRGKASDVVGIHALVGDIDCKGGVHNEKNLPTRDEALQFISELPFKPSMIIWSGGGYQVYWLFDEPWIFDSPEDRQKASDFSLRWQRFIVAKGKEKGWKLDSVGSIEHLFRIPGMYNCKADPIPVEIIEKNDFVYSVELIQEFLDDIPQEVPEQGPQTGGDPIRTIDTLSFSIKHLIENGAEKGKRSEAIGSVLAAMARAVVPEDEIFSTFEAEAIGEKYREKGQFRWDWLKPQIEKAKKYVMRDKVERLKPKIQCQDRLKKRADLIIHQTASPCGPFDTSCLPKSLATYINSICTVTEADPIMVTTSVLCMISAFMKRSCFIPEFDPLKKSPVYFQNLYPNVWFLNISRSGTFKSTALNKGFKLAYDKDEETEVLIKNATLQQQIQALQESITLLPTRITIEAFIEHLSDGYGGALVCSEYGTWLESLEKNYNLGLKPLFTELYDVPRIYTYKTKGSGELKVKEPFITICGASTTEWVRRNVGPEDVSSGFFARFLIFYPPQNDSIPSALPKAKGPIDPAVEKKVKDILEQLPRKISYELTPESEEAFRAFHEGLYSSFKEELSERGREMLEPYIKRWSPYALKIGILLQPFVDSSSCTIGLTALQGAIKIVEYAMQSTKWLFQNELGESDFQRKCRRVLEYIAKRGGEVGRQSLISSKILESGVKEYDQVLESLEQAGRIEIQGRAKRSQKISLASDSVE